MASAALSGGGDPHHHLPSDLVYHHHLKPNSLLLNISLSYLGWVGEKDGNKRQRSRTGILETELG